MNVFFLKKQINAHSSEVWQLFSQILWGLFHLHMGPITNHIK